MQIEPKLHLRKSPVEIVDEMIKLFNHQEMVKNGKIPQHLRQLRPECFIDPPKHIQQAIAIASYQIKRAKCAETFKTWGAPEHIAANMFKTKLPEPSSTVLSRVGPSGFFPCPPVLQNQLSSDVLE